jgi:ribosomal protein S18 acetylase RimI-like enzyme
MLIRPATSQDIPAIARVNVDSWRSTYHGIVSNAFLDQLSYAKQKERNRRYMAEPGIHLVAEMPNAGVVGYVRGGRLRGKDISCQAEIYALYILQPYRGIGIGSALFRRWCDGQRKLGFDSALVWVLEQNKSAVAFYKRLGGLFVREQSIDIGGQSLIEHAYRWDKLPLAD